MSQSIATTIDRYSHNKTVQQSLLCLRPIPQCAGR